MKAQKISRRTGDRLSALEDQGPQTGQFLDLCLSFRSKATGETLLKVGGVWDREAQKYTEQEAATGRIIWVNPNQVEIVRSLKRWIEAYLERGRGSGSCSPAVIAAAENRSSQRRACWRSPSRFRAQFAG
jgi:hypothetical protein